LFTLNVPQLQRQSQAEWREKRFSFSKKQAEIAIFISDQANFKTKFIRRDKGHFILIKGTIHQEEITIINIYALNIGAFSENKN
jgi:UDP-2,3-diacylglucosamine pyrophosphatase LpxH